MALIDCLERMPIHGNAHDDRELLGISHIVIVNPRNSLTVRGRALRMIDRAMGECEIDPTDVPAVSEALREYLSYL